MALKFKKPFRSRLTVAGTVVKQQQREGVSFYIIPTVVVLAVLIFCYTANPPASARVAAAEKAASTAAPAAEAKAPATKIAATTKPTENTTTPPQPTDGGAALASATMRKTWMTDTTISSTWKRCDTTFNLPTWLFVHFNRLSNRANTSSD